MANIGTFKKLGNGEFQGEIVTLSLQTKGVRIVPEPNRAGASDNAPTHRVYAAKADIGAGWSKRVLVAIVKKRHLGADLRG
jgi:uncharacterized protein (DUF736 family)